MDPCERGRSSPRVPDHTHLSGYGWGGVDDRRSRKGTWGRDFDLPLETTGVGGGYKDPRRQTLCSMNKTL